VLFRSLIVIFLLGHYLFPSLPGDPKISVGKREFPVSGTAPRQSANMIVVEMTGKNIGNVVFGEAPAGQIFFDGVGTGVFSKIANPNIKQNVFIAGLD